MSWSGASRMSSSPAAPTKQRTTALVPNAGSGHLLLTQVAAVIGAIPRGTTNPVPSANALCVPSA